MLQSAKEDCHKQFIEFGTKDRISQKQDTEFVTYRTKDSLQARPSIGHKQDTNLAINRAEGLHKQDRRFVTNRTKIGHKKGPELASNRTIFAMNKTDNLPQTGHRMWHKKN